MSDLTRRRLLLGLGPCIGAAGLLERFSDTAIAHDVERKLPWRYLRLDPQATADRAYELYAKGGCMYAAFASIASQLSERVGEPYSSFPLDMMRYGGGGLAGLGSLCGAVNGAAAALALIAEDARHRSRMTRDIARWYEETELPVYVPKGTTDAAVMPRSSANSILCKNSVTMWSKVSGSAPDSPQKAERCRRLTADIVHRTVELLNEARTQPRKSTER